MHTIGKTYVGYNYSSSTQEHNKYLNKIRKRHQQIAQDLNGNGNSISIPESPPVTPPLSHLSLPYSPQSPRIEVKHREQIDILHILTDSEQFNVLMLYESLVFNYIYIYSPCLLLPCLALSFQLLLCFTSFFYGWRGGFLASVQHMSNTQWNDKMTNDIMTDDKWFACIHLHLYVNAFTYIHILIPLAHMHIYLYMYTYTFMYIYIYI